MKIKTHNSQIIEGKAEVGKLKNQNKQCKKKVGKDIALK